MPVKHSGDAQEENKMCLFKCASSHHQAEWKHEPSNLPPGWPTEGCINIRGFSLRYRHDLDPAIRSITINISGGEKVCFNITALKPVVHLHLSTF